MRPLHPLFRGRKGPLHISHRGGAALAPENTLAAFRAAAEQWKTDMLELDVHFSRDGEAWVSHDPTVDRCTDGSGAIAALTSAELVGLDAGFRFTPDGRAFPFRGKGARLPRLEDVLSAFPSLLFNIDLKVEGPGAAESFADLLKKSPAADRVCCGAEWEASASALAERMPGACLFYPRDPLAGFVMSVRAGVAPPVDDRFHVLDLPFEYEGVRLVDAPLVAAAREAGAWMNVWTVDDEAEMRRLAELGVGGIMTDRPDLLRRVLQS